MREREGEGFFRERKRDKDEDHGTSGFEMQSGWIRRDNPGERIRCRPFRVLSEIQRQGIYRFRGSDSCQKDSSLSTPIRPTRRFLLSP